MATTKDFNYIKTDIDPPYCAIMLLRPPHHRIELCGLKAICRTCLRDLYAKQKQYIATSGTTTRTTLFYFASCLCCRSIEFKVQLNCLHQKMFFFTLFCIICTLYFMAMVFFKNIGSVTLVTEVML